jgi:hypothetical protein
MSSRQQPIRRARSAITDQQLSNFFRAIRDKNTILAVKLINEHIDRGDSFDSIFNSSSDFGFTLSIRRRQNSTFTIYFGCIAGPEAGDGGEWLVEFNDQGRVLTIEETGQWIS